MEVERPIRRLVSKTLARIMAGWTGESEGLQIG